MSTHGAPRWEPIEPPAPPSTPQPLRLGQVLEIGLRILRRHWSVVLVVALLFAGPGALLTSATSLHFTEVAGAALGLDDGTIDPGVMITEAELERLLDALVPFLAATLVAGILLSVGALVFSAVVADDYHARIPELGAILRRGLGRTPSALGFIIVTSFVVVGVMLAGLLAMSVATLLLPPSSIAAGGPGVFLALVFGVATVVGLIYLSMRWAPAFPAMIEEDIGVLAALRRSWHLSGDNVWRTFVVLLLGGLLTAIGGSVVGQLATLVLWSVLGIEESLATTVALSLGSVLLAPVTPVLTAVLYFDLRARRDAPGVVPTPPRQAP
jgi:hypothetical protein